MDDTKKWRFLVPEGLAGQKAVTLKEHTAFWPEAHQSGAHPGVMKDAVCSPGGTTIKGVAALERGGLRAAVLDAIDAIEGE